MFFKRRVLLINRRFQLSFMAFSIALTFVAIGAFYVSELYFFWKFAEKGRAIGLPESHVFFRFLKDQKTTMDLIFGVTSFLTFVALSVGGLLLSHRVAGPIYRLTRHFESIAGGEKAGPVKFRKGDFFPELADAYNRQLEAGSHSGSGRSAG